MNVNTSWTAVLPTDWPNRALGACNAENAIVLKSQAMTSLWSVRSPTSSAPRVIISSPKPTPIAPSTDHSSSSELALPQVTPAKERAARTNMAMGPIHAQPGPLRKVSNRVMRHHPSTVMATTRNAHPSSVGIA